jgi:hypothetical protein
VTFTSFLPAMSTKALKAKSAELRAMRIHRRTTLSLRLTSPRRIHREMTQG